MKTRHNIYTGPVKPSLIAFLLLPLFYVAIGCEGFVEVDRPSGQLTTQAVFEDKTTATAALLNIYAQLRDDGMLTGSNLSITSNMAAYADDFNFYGIASNTTLNFYNNTLLASNGQVASWWQSAYRQIYAANAVIEGVLASGSITTTDKGELVAQAVFLRSLIHFNLANLYGDIPFAATTDYELNKDLGRTPVSQVYSFIVTDLLSAAQSLPEEYPAPDRTRPNRATVMALLARVYLYQGAWQEAATAASYVIGNTQLYNLPTDLGSTFLNDSPSTIWQYSPALPGDNSAEGGAFIIATTPPDNLAMSSSLLDSFEPGDLRRQAWVGSITDGTTIWYYPFKYKQKYMTVASVESSILFRLSEQYLIRAEAQAHLGELTAAATDLNTIRNNAGLPAISPVTEQQLLQAIVQERRVELFGEGGHRFFDLKRTLLLDTVLGGLKPGWQSTDQVLPIPESELLLNPNLAPQNAGY